MGADTPTPLLVAEDLHVDYRVFAERALSLRDRVVQRRVHREAHTVHAVRGVSMTLSQGESLAIVGSNGSGKSTLLGALTGLVPITRGTVLVRSRPTLLGVGAALRPQLSGRTNMLIGGLAIGLSRDEIASQLDEMIEFSGLRESIDLPMQTYSAGMRARLIFTVATARTPEILMIDEALAVGDAQFRVKSQERIDEIRAQAGGVILVSHNMREVAETCDRAIWLDRGVARADGPTEEVLEAYHASVAVT